MAERQTAPEVVNRAVLTAVCGEWQSADGFLAGSENSRMEPSDWPPVGLLASGGNAHSRQQA